MNLREVKLRTLIVEDNVSYGKIFKETLQALFPSMAIQEAGEGNEALQKIDALRPELIFMDVRLPDANGFHLTEKIKTSYPDTKVAILTSYDIQEYRQAAIRCGADCFMPKDSFNWEQIEKLVRSFFE